MDRRVTLHKHREGSDNLAVSTEDNTFLPPVFAPSPSTPSIVLTIPPEEIKEESSSNVLFNNNNAENNRELDSIKLEPVTILTSDVGTLEASTSSTCYVAKRRRREEDRESGASSEPRRKRKVSWTSSSVHSDVVSEGRRTPKCAKESPMLESRRSPKKTNKTSINTKEDSSKETDIRTTDRQYYSAIGDQRHGWLSKEELEAEEPIETDTVPVPSWRVKTVNSCYSMEGTENLDDEVYNKRHSRLEIDERRRKRWDVQRIREQRHLEKLKQRESSRRSSTATRVREEGNASPVYETLWPDPDEIEFIEVCEQLPVTAFGVPMMDFAPSEFFLPWLTAARTKPPTTLPTPNRRRHGAKR